MTTLARPFPPRSSRAARRRALAGALFVAPCVLFVAVFFLTPLVMTAWMSLNSWPLLGAHHFIGLGNYRELMADRAFWSALGFTFKYALLVTPLIFLVAFGLALIVQRPVRGVGLLRTAYFLPVVVGLGSASVLWVWMLNGQVGVFNAVAQALHFTQDPIPYLDSARNAMITALALIVWKTAGLSMLLLLIGLQAIPADYYEAATIDGASSWQRLIRITLPLMRRTFALALVLSVTGSLLAFDQFYILSHGGPQGSTVTAVYWIFNTSFGSFRLGYGAALSLVLLVILVLVSVAQLYFLRDDTEV
ncbi:carbohydrate ABC transporter permease [Deinococcus sp.]|uniref:carbohydrate ABC transporter permease n=1 Tax=Deinococcus sp. TaxID=47478 RepID=UPI003C7D5D47